MSTEQRAHTTPMQMMWQMLRSNPLWYLAHLLTLISVAMVEIVPGILTRDILNAMQQTAEPSLPWLMLGAFVGVTLVRVMLYLLGTYANIRMRIPLIDRMRRALMARLLSVPALVALKGSPGDIVSRVRDDIRETPQILPQFNEIVSLLGFAAVAFTLMFQKAPLTTLYLVAPFVLIIAGIRIAAARIYYYRQERRRANGRVLGFIGEVFGAVQAVQVAGAESHVLRQFAELNDIRERATLREVLFDAILSAFVRNTVSIGTAIMMLTVGQLGLDGQFRAGDVAFFVYNLGIISDLLGEIGLFIGRQQQMSVSLQRLEHVSHGMQADQLLTHTEPQTATALPPLQRLQVRHLSVQWPDGSYGVRDVQFELRPGTLVAVTGVVGAGKTSLMRGLLGMLPHTQADIVWNGVPVVDAALQFVPPAVAYTSQVPRLFSESIRANVLQGRSFTPQALTDAIQGAVFEYDVAQFDDGVETLVGARGVRLSGGQVQRSAFARMLYNRPQFWCIDDVSSALDVATEQQLWQCFAELRADVACLVITHRMQVLAMADEILVLDGGQIVARGTLDELQAQGFLQFSETRGDE